MQWNPNPNQSQKGSTADIHDVNELKYTCSSEKSQDSKATHYSPHMYETLKRQGPETETNQWLSELRVSGEVDTEKLFGGVELFSIVLMVKPLDAFCQDMQNCTLNVGKFCCIYIISQ